MVEPLLSDVKKSRAYQEIAEEITEQVTLQVTQQNRREFAKAMLKKNMNLDLISELTGLSQEEILALGQQLHLAKN